MEALGPLDPIGFKTLVAKGEIKDQTIQELQAQIDRLTRALAPTPRLRPAIVARLRPTQSWKRLNFSKDQKGFYATQLSDLSKALTDAHVAPDGVKFMWSIGLDAPHRGWISAFVREGDDLPVVYSLKEEVNPGTEGAVETTIEEKLKDREILPIGWTFGSKTFVYATAELPSPHK